MSTLEQQEQSEAIQLFTIQDQNGQVDSVVPLRWCISRETAHMLQGGKIGDPYLLIAIENGGQEMSRYLVPLTAEMCYVQFRRPGENVVHATIVWSGQFNDQKVEEVFSNKDDYGNYVADVLTVFQPGVDALEERVRQLNLAFYEASSKEDEQAQDSLRAEVDQVQAELREARSNEPERYIIPKDFRSVEQLGQEAQLAVLVPIEMFAKTPPRWMTWLGKRYTFWDRAPRDQCDLRRRAIFTGATLPLLLLFYAVFGTIVEVINLLVTGVLLLFGMRELDFAPLRHPFTNAPNETWMRQKASFWWTKKEVHTRQRIDYTDTYVTYTDRHPVFFAVNPPVVVGLTLAGVVLYHFFGSVLFIILGALMAFVIGLVILVVSILVGGSIPQYNLRRSEKKKLEQEAASRHARVSLRQDLELLACDGRSREVRVSALPKGRRTVVLRFQDLKSKVCRPFAR